MPEDRRLAAIMFTDIVGYTALMGSDEEKAFKILRKNRNIQKPLIKKYRGKWLKEMGDGILASFNNSSDAVRCAGEIQKEAKKEGIPLRIGIHEGEVVFEGGDVLGDGVNVASRLEELAEKGCIIISGAIYKDIKNKAGITTEFIEEKKLKNVEEPVKVYKASYDESVEDKLESIKERNTKRQNISYILIGIVVVVIAFLFIRKFISFREEVELDQSIAVLPFNYLGEDLSKQYEAEGVMTAIYNHLSKVKALKVIGKTSTGRYRDNIGDPKDIGKDLNVSYLLEGSFQIFGGNARLNVSLISTVDGSSVWANEYDREWKDIFYVQSDVAKSISNEIKVILSPEEKQSIETIPTSNLVAYDFYVQGEELWSKSNEEKDLRSAIRMYTEAIQIDSKFTLAWIGLAARSRSLYWFHTLSGVERVKARQYLDKAIALSANSKEVRFEEGKYYQQCERNYFKAIEIYEQLISEYPNDDKLYYWTGLAYRRYGEFHKSIEYSNTAISLNPLYWRYWLNAGITHLALGEYIDAENSYRKAIDLNPLIFEPYIFLLNLYSVTGEITKAQDILKSNPDIIDYPEIKIRSANIEILDGNYNEAIKILESFGNDVIEEMDFYHTKHLKLGEIYFMMSNERLAEKHFNTERIFLEKRIKELSNDHRLYRSLGIVYAGLGNKQKAIKTGSVALDFFNFDVDALDGYYTEMDMAKILLMVEEYDDSLTKLAYLLDHTGKVSIENLKLDPFWNPVRDMDRFKEIISNPKYQIDLSNN
jgi:class 3 adenylate cyclase/TolB-like protein